MVTFNKEEWLKALGEVCKKGNGASTEDLANAWGICQRAANMKIKSFIKSGVLVYSGKEKRINIIGSSQMVPVYSLVKKHNK